MRGMIGSALFGVGVFVVLAGTARGVLPPYVYRERQEKAPEALTIKVVKARVARTSKPDETVYKVHATAIVTAVQRTATGLRPKQRITIRYTVVERKTPTVGEDAQPLLVKSGKSYSAWLARAKGASSYGLGAGGVSFETASSR